MMSYLIEKLVGGLVAQVARRETKRQAFYCAMYQPPGGYLVREGDRVIYRVMVGSPAARST